MLPLLWIAAVACHSAPVAPRTAAPLLALDDAAISARVRPRLGPGQVLAHAVLSGQLGAENTALLVITEHAADGLQAQVFPLEGPPQALPIALSPPPWRAGPAVSADVDGDGRFELALMFEDRGDRLPASALAHPSAPSRPPMVGEPAQGTFRTVVLRVDAAGRWSRDAALEAKVAGLAGPLPVQKALLGVD